MKFPLTACALFICAACSTTTTSENTSDSTDVDSTELAVNTMPSDFSEGGALYIKDTTFTEVLPPSSFTSPQLDNKVAYVFSPGGLEVYETASGENVLASIDYGSRVSLALPLLNNTPTDTMTIDGLKGRLVQMSYGGKPGFVFSGYLVGMPVPADGSTIIEYFTKSLHLVKPATRTAHECMNCEDMFSEATYEFENGVVLREKFSYESYENGVTFKSMITLQEVYLLARYFYKRVDEEVAEFPGSESEEQKEFFLVSIGAKEGRITSITVGGGEGCSEEESVYEGEGEMLMSSSGGC